MKKLCIIMSATILMVACNNADTTDSTSGSGDTITSEPAMVDTLSSTDTTARLNADSAIRK